MDIYDARSRHSRGGWSQTSHDPKLSSEGELSELKFCVRKYEKAIRRRGACIPCRASKTRCDGKDPCGACRDDKRKRKICKYSDSDEARRHVGRQKQADTPSPTANPSINLSAISSEMKMHKALSLPGIIAEFIGITSTRGYAGEQISCIRKLWSNFKRSSVGNVQWTGTSSSSSDTGVQLNRSLCYVQETGAALQIEVGMWQTRLSDAVALVKEGRLMTAWNSVTEIMHGIEFLDVEYGPQIQQSRRLSENTNSMCLQLIELECALSFFVGGGSNLLSWSSSRFLSAKIEQRKTDDPLFASKIKLYDEIQGLLQIDVSDKEGLWKFLQTANEMQRLSPAAELVKISVCTAEDDSAEQQELRLISHLVFSIVHCRMAVICGHYTENEQITASDHPSSIVYQLKLCSMEKKASECRQVLMHARAVLDAFENLCRMDTERTAQNWFRLCGALIAAILVGVSELRSRKKDHNAVQQQLRRIEDGFRKLQNWNKSSPIFERAYAILQQCRISARPPTVRLETRPSRKRCRKDSVAEGSFADAEAQPAKRVKSKSVSRGPSLSGNDKARKIRTCTSKRKSMTTPLRTPMRGVMVAQGNEDSQHEDRDSPRLGSFEQTLLEQTKTFNPSPEGIANMSQSFHSTASTLNTTQETMENKWSSPVAGYHPLPSEGFHPPHQPWICVPEIPPYKDYEWCGHEPYAICHGVGSMIPLIPQVNIREYQETQMDKAHQSARVVSAASSTDYCDMTTTWTSAHSSLLYGPNETDPFQRRRLDEHHINQGTELNMEAPFLPADFLPQVPEQFESIGTKPIPLGESSNDNQGTIFDVQSQPLRSGHSFSTVDESTWFSSSFATTSF